MDVDNDLDADGIHDVHDEVRYVFYLDLIAFYKDFSIN